jgi:hypothetical protein
MRLLVFVVSDVSSSQLYTMINHDSSVATNNVLKLVRLSSISFRETQNLTTPSKCFIVPLDLHALFSAVHLSGTVLYHANRSNSRRLHIFSDLAK